MTRRAAIDPAVADLLTGLDRAAADRKLPTAQRARAKRERARQADRHRVTYDLTQETINKIFGLAEFLECPASQVAEVLLSIGLLNLSSDIQNILQQHRRPSRCSLYEWKLDIDKIMNDLNR